MEEPRFGKRSPQWQPDRDPITPEVESSTPWETLGELHVPASRFKQVEYSSPSSSSSLEDAELSSRLDERQARRRAAAAPHSSSSPAPSPSSSSPFAPPTGTPQVGSAQTGHAQALRKSGKRFMIFGLLLSFLIAPIFAIGYVFVSSDLNGLANRMKPVSAGAQVQIDASRGYFVMDTVSDATNECTLKASDGTNHRMEPIPSTQPTFWIADLPEGTYSLTCLPAGSTGIIGATGLNPHEVAQNTSRALMLSTIMGFTGIGVAIVGGRRVSRARRL